MPLEDYLKTMEFFAASGCRAVTITGGGEPTLHKNINKILSGTASLGLQMGMVTNGLSINSVNDYEMRLLTWCRISFSDDREFSQQFICNIIDAINAAPEVDWAFSYVLTAKPNYVNLARLIVLANELKFTHVRIVTDLLDLDGVPDMGEVKTKLAELGVNDSLVIYQGRKEYTPGAKRCLISLIKPVISADGGWYPCCGVQYAQDTPSADFDASMCMGKDYREITKNQHNFDGSQCVRCYYGDYNQTLAAIIDPVAHGFFV